MRLAWFSPWPPQPSGIAGRSCALVRALAAAGHAIDVFVDAARVEPDRPVSPDAPGPGHVRVLSAHDAVWRLARGQYDLPVYQLGNSRLHDYIWPYLFRWPGLTVLHDARLHHARGDALLRRGRHDDYRAEFAFNHPDVPIAAAELAIAGFDGPYYALWPMTRAVVEASRAIAVHARGSADDLAADYPGRLVRHVPLGEGSPEMTTEEARRATRASFALDPDAVVFGVFGGLTLDKRVPQILDAFARTRRYHPAVQLLLAGTPDPRLALDRRLADLGIAAAVRHVSGLDDAGFDEAIAAVDVGVHLRWPSALETSGPWLRALSAARATVVIDQPYQAHLPALDPRTWQPVSGSTGEPVAVAIDILDEDHSLRLTMNRLATDAALRARLGAAARRYWCAAHTEAHMTAAYEDLLPIAAARPAPDTTLPAHLRPDPTTHIRSLLAALPEVSCELR